MVNNSLGILEAIRQRHGDCSWYRVAKLLEVAPSRVIQIKNGAEVMSKNIAVKAAELLGVEPADLVLIVESERATDPALKSSYKRLMARAGIAVAAVGQGMICILCKIKRDTRSARVHALPGVV